LGTGRGIQLTREIGKEKEEGKIAKRGKRREERRERKERKEERGKEREEREEKEEREERGKSCNLDCVNIQKTPKSKKGSSKNKVKRENTARHKNRLPI